MTEPSRPHDARTVAVRVPISIRKRGGRKLVLTPALGAVYHLRHVVMRPRTAGYIRAAGGPRN